MLEILARMSRERHQLAERLVVEAGVLPDVQRGEVEAERIHRAQHRQRVPFRDAPRADFHERGVEFFQVGGEFAGAGIRTRMRRVARVGGVARQLEQEQPGVLFPGFLGRVVEDGLPAFARFLHEPGQVRGKRRGRTLDVVRQAQAAGEMRQLAADDEQPARAQFGQRFARGVRRDERVAVAVSADPGAEAQPGQRATVAEQRGVEAGVGPRLPQPAVEFRQGAGKHLAEIIHEVAAFGGDLRFAQEDFAGAPEPFEGDLDLLAPVGEFERGVAGVLAGVKELEKSAVLLQGRGPLGLGGMGGENRLDDHLRQTGGDFLRAQAGMAQPSGGSRPTGPAPRRCRPLFRGRGGPARKRFPQSG